MNTINTKVQELQQQKEALDARIAKLEELENSTTPVKNLLVSLLADYATEALEELPIIWEEILAIGQQHGLSVQPLAVNELREWEADRAELENLRREVKILRFAIAQVQPDNESKVWRKGEIAPELEKLYQEALVETESEATAELTDEEYEAAVEEELALDDDEKDIPALTLWQPWATLIEQEVKRVETRSWGTNYRGPIAIHAAKKPVAISDCPHLFELVPYGCEFPFGAVVAIANLINCVQMTPKFIAQQSETELMCGDWQAGRFAWILEIIRPVVPPIPVSGGQKLWNWSGTSITAELEYLEKLKATLEPDSAIYEEVSAASLEPEYEPEKASVNLIDRILISHGFFMPDMKIGDQYSEDEKYEDYQGWASYRQSHDRGVTGIGLYHEKFGFWDASTEMIGEDDTTFPEDFSDGNAILTWLRSVIDEVVAITPVENSEVPGQLSLEFPDPTSEQIEEELGCNWEDEEETAPRQAELQKLLVGNSDFTFEELGVHVNFQSVIAAADDTVDFESEEVLITVTDAQQTRQYHVNAQTFIYQYNTIDSLEQAALGYAQYFLRDLEKQAKAKKEITQWNAENAQQSEPAKPDDEFVEFVKISNAVGYLKRRDNNELIGYTAFSNKLPDGHRAVTQAKSRAAKWVEWLKGTFELECDAPRIAKRMISDNSKQPFAYEVKLKGLSIGQLTKLAEEDLSLLPGEVEEQQQNTELLRSETKASPTSPDKIEQAAEPGNDGLTDELTLALAVKSTFTGLALSPECGLNEDELELVEMAKAAILECDSEMVKSVNSVFKEVCEKNAANRVKVWNALTEEQQQTYKLLLQMEFAKAPDFAEQTPEYIVTIDGGKPITNVWISLREVDGKLARMWRYKGQKDEIGYATKEAAAIAAISQQAG